MENFLKTKSKQKEKKNKDEVVDIIHRNNYSEFSILNLAVIILSCFSVLSDICTDLVLVIQYSYQGHKAWALGTFVLIFLPSLIVQFFSMKWHISDKSVNVFLWVLHVCMLGILYRYFVIIKFSIKAFKSKSSSDIEKVYLDQSDLCMLHLFESFLESAPQLVLQTYVIIAISEWQFWTVLSAIISLFSLAWALVAYSKSQRQARPNKHKSTWPGLVLQAIWRAGMLTARITTLVLAAYCFGNYFFIFIILHWIAMTAWIIYQKTDFCETFWEERIYNAVVGIIYIFCFFNLLEGQSRWRLLTFYLVMVFQNLSCLKFFLLWFAESNPKLAIFSFISIVGGMSIGTISMVLYYRFFHPSAPIKFFCTKEENFKEQSPAYASLTLRSLKRLHCDSPKTSFQKESTKQLHAHSPLSDSVIIEESSFENDTDTDTRTLRNWIDEKTDNKKKSFSPVTNVAKQVVTKNSSTDTDAYKRRAICSSVDLEKLLESKADGTDLSKKLDLVETDEAVSEILSSHDYENLCAVNIAREAWGLRSWKGYVDIETWLHDDSVNNDRKLDTLTSTTGSSDILSKDGEGLQDDYIENSMLSETETVPEEILPQFSIDTFPIYPLGTLPPIFEEVEEASVITDLSPDIKISEGCASTLVATIDEIRRNTPIQNRFRTVERIYDVSPMGSLKLSPVQKWSKIRKTPKLLLFPQNNIKSALAVDRDKCIISKINHAQLPKSEEKINNDLKKSVKYSDLPIISREKEKNFNEIIHAEKSNVSNNEENIPTVASKINHWNKILNSEKNNTLLEKDKTLPTKTVNVKETRNLFLKKVLTPHSLRTLETKKNNS